MSLPTQMIQQFHKFWINSELLWKPLWNKDSRQGIAHTRQCLGQSQTRWKAPGQSLLHDGLVPIHTTRSLFIPSTSDPSELKLECFGSLFYQCCSTVPNPSCTSQEGKKIKRKRKNKKSQPPSSPFVVEANYPKGWQVEKWINQSFVMSALFIVSNFAQLSCGSAKQCFYSSLLSLMLFLPFLPSLAFYRSFAPPHHRQESFSAAPNHLVSQMRWGAGEEMPCRRWRRGDLPALIFPVLPLCPCDNQTSPLGLFPLISNSHKSRCWDSVTLFSPSSAFSLRTLLSLRPLPPAAAKTFKRKNGTCWQEAGKQGTFNQDPAWKQCPGKGPTNTSDVKHQVHRAKRQKMHPCEATARLHLLETAAASTLWHFKAAREWDTGMRYPWQGVKVAKSCIEAARVLLDVGSKPGG